MQICISLQVFINHLKFAIKKAEKEKNRNPSLNHSTFLQATPSLESKSRSTLSCQTQISPAGKSHMKLRVSADHLSQILLELQRQKVAAQDNLFPALHQRGGNCLLCAL